MALTVVFVLQCDHCEKTEEAQQILSFVPLSDIAPIYLDISESTKWEVLDDTLFCAPCAKYLVGAACNA